MSFSSILDISSFFIGMIINLIFVALMCYYFKRKYDYLETAQTEQAKILYQMIHKNTERVDYSNDPLVHMDRLDPEIDSDSDSDSDSEVMPHEVSELASDLVSEPLSRGTEVTRGVDPTRGAELTQGPDLVLETELLEVEEAEPRMETKEIVLESFEITLNEPESTYSKMSMKELKEILSSKGIRAKNNIKKNELIELISKEA
jgi:hypothetical protein